MNDFSFTDAPPKSARGGANVEPNRVNSPVSAQHVEQAASSPPSRERRRSSLPNRRRIMVMQAIKALDELSEEDQQYIIGLYT